MQVKTQQLVTIICEAILESFLKKELPELGVTGYTITDARGMGSMGKRSGKWRKESNIRLEILCDDAVAEQVIQHVHEEYGENYALMVFSGERLLHMPSD